MEENVDLDGLVGSWLLVEADRRLVGNKSGPTRLGFALSLKFFELHGRFPDSLDEFEPAVVDFVADQITPATPLTSAISRHTTSY